MIDDQGLRNVLFWPHAAWDGIDGSNRCCVHTKIAPPQWIRLF
jgi:hypothetical protein